MNSSVEPPDETPTSKLFRSSPEPIAQPREIARLSEEVEQLKDKLGDVIFMSAFVVILITDVFVFQKLEAWTSPIVLGVLEVAFLFMLARVCRVNDITRLTETVFDGIERYKGTKNGGLPKDGT